MELAKVFVDSGEFYWNSGIFLWSANTIIKSNEDFLPEVAANLGAGAEIYGTPKRKSYINTNFQLAPTCLLILVSWRKPTMYMYLGDFSWSDLGHMGSLYDLSKRNQQECCFEMPVAFV